LRKFRQMLVLNVPRTGGQHATTITTISTHYKITTIANVAVTVLSLQNANDANVITPNKVGRTTASTGTPNYRQLSVLQQSGMAADIESV
jgi:hypothetical protein